MTYQRQGEAKEERGSDQLVLQLGSERWQVVWRYVFFQPAGDAG
jgi:hypothetical protein